MIEFHIVKTRERILLKLLKEEKPVFARTKKLDNFLTFFFLPGLYPIPFLLKKAFCDPN